MQRLKSIHEFQVRSGPCYTGYSAGLRTVKKIAPLSCHVNNLPIYTEDHPYPLSDGWGRNLAAGTQYPDMQGPKGPVWERSCRSGLHRCLNGSRLSDSPSDSPNIGDHNPARFNGCSGHIFLQDQPVRSILVLTKWMYAIDRRRLANWNTGNHTARFRLGVATLEEFLGGARK